MDYEAVFWDVGGVILNIGSIDEAQTAFLERAIERYGLPSDVGEARERWRDAMRAHFAGREGRAYRTAREARAKAAAALFDGDEPDDWRDLYHALTDEHVRLNPGVEATLERIHDAGLYQAVVSDADEDLAERLEHFGLRPYFDDVTTSEAVGYVKPDDRMFERAFEKARAAGVDPQRGVMIGDKYDNDMEGGSAHGLTTVGFGAEDGPAVDHHVEAVPELLDVLGIDAD
jgi:putative hydrolase of the HAD superfamily